MEKTLLSKILPVLGMLLVLAAIVAVGFVWGSNNKNDEWQLKWTARDASDIQADLAFTAEQRRIELRRQGEMDAIQKKAAVDMANARANTDLARAESGRLQLGIAAAIEQLRQSGSGTGVATVSSSGGKAGLLLAQLYREIDEAATRYAEEADRAHAAGLRCEAAWDALRVKN